MHLIALLALALLVIVFAEPAEAKVRCSSGTTAFVSGDLRIFGTWFLNRFEDGYEEFGYEEFACVGRTRRPLRVGSDVSTSGTGSSETRAYATARGGRLLAAYDVEDGEGGPGADLDVVDVRRRRTINFMNVIYDDPVPAFRVTSSGALLLLDADMDLLYKGRGRRVRELASDNVRDLATSGDTVYWSQAGAARMTTIDGADMGRMLEPVRFHRRGGPCAAMRGRTIAASGSVRVVRRGGRHVACRVGVAGRFRVGTAGDPAPTVVGDRWLLLHRAGGVKVFDSRTGRAVTTAGPAAAADLLRDGTLAWLDEGGRLLATAPGAEPVELAAAGATSLATARRAIYWTEAGTPHRYRP